MSANFPKLFSPISIGKCLVHNRIVSTGHHTYLADKVPGDELIAYHEARAKGGAGLIVSEIVATHWSAGFSSKLLTADCEDVIPAYRRLVETCQAHGTKMFAQLFHPGREILSSPDGMSPLAWAPSAVPNERFHIMPRPMPISLIKQVIEGFGIAAKNLSKAGFDGLEIVASHGYLPAQFLDPAINQREDGYGGSFDNRLRFLRELIVEIRAVAGGITLGIRISPTESDGFGLAEKDIVEICKTVAPQIDYVSIVMGSSAGLGSSVHISPPMGLPHGYAAKFSKQIREMVDIPVMVTGRINQPQIAEQILANGEADLCGMTRAMICDPDIAVKARENRLEDIRACIGCNQSCIGRAHKGLAISCIQHPESGRELQFNNPPSIEREKNIFVAGGGVAGMKAAAVAAGRGHTVTLFEKQKQLGGQCNNAMRLPGREEFGGIVTNLHRELSAAGVEIILNKELDVKTLEANQADAVIVATGAVPYVPKLEGIDQPNVVLAQNLISGETKPGMNVVIADWKANWVGLGIAEMCALQGCSVTLCVNAAMAGESLQVYTRNHYVGRLHKLVVEIKTHVRLFGIDEGAVYFQDVLTGEPVVLESIDTVVLALGYVSNSKFESKLAERDIEKHVIGDCLIPRTAEEAIYQGLQTGWMI